MVSGAQLATGGVACAALVSAVCAATTFSSASSSFSVSWFWLFLAAVAGVVFILRSGLMQRLRWPKMAAVQCPTPTEEEVADVIIIGAGIVGSALAHMMGRSGKKVLLLERDLSEPNRIVGELLQPGGVEQLAQLDLLSCIEGIDAARTSGYVVFNGKEQVLLNYEEIRHYDPVKGAVEKELRECKGASFHHGRFVMNLRRAAAAAPNVTVQEAVAQALLEQKNANGGMSVVGVKYKADGEVVEAKAPLVIACDGCNSKFRRQIVDNKPKAESSFVGLVLDDCDLPYSDRGHVILVDPSPILAYPVSSTETRILVDIPHPLPSASTGELEAYMREFVCPQLPKQMQPSLINALDEKKLRSMPCSRLHPEFTQQPGFLLLGDSWNMRHPLTGAGMSVGLRDVVTLKGMLADGMDFQQQGDTQNRFHELFRARARYACTSNALAQALYGVFSTHEPVMAHMREACFGYFKLGSVAVGGPVSMLSCIRLNPLLLVVHFVAVAIYSVLLTLLPFPWPSKIVLMCKIGWAAASLLLPLLWYEHLVPFLLNV